MARQGNNLKVSNSSTFHIWEDPTTTIGGNSQKNGISTSPLKEKRQPLRGLAVSNHIIQPGLTKFKTGTSNSQPQPRQLSDSSCGTSLSQGSTGQTFSIFCDDEDFTTVHKLPDQSKADEKDPIGSWLSEEAECCLLPPSISDQKSGNTQPFGDLTLDKENIPEDLNSLPSRLTAAPCRVAIGRQILGQLNFDESLKDECEEEDSVFEEGDEDVDEHYESVASTPYFIPQSRLEKESHADLIYGCPEYADSIYAYLREREEKLRPKSYYMKKQSDINETMRSILIDWLLEVAIEYSLEEETYFLAVGYVDRFLSLMSVTRNKLQLLGTAATFIASKFEEIYPPDVKEFVYITDDSYSKAQISKMEQLILSTLNFDMAAPTAHCFITIFAKAMRCDRQTTFLAIYLCELALLDVSFLAYLPSQIAASAICLANMTVGEIPWSEKIEILSGYAVSDFYPCMEQLLETFKKAPNCPQQAAREKFSNTKYFQVALLSPPEALPPAE